MAADDGGMLLGNMDLSYLGVHSIWTNDLGMSPPKIIICITLPSKSTNQTPQVKTQSPVLPQVLPYPSLPNGNE